MYTASIISALYSGAARACRLDVLFMASAISRTPMTVSLLRGGVLLSKTTHAPVAQQYYNSMLLKWMIEKNQKVSS